MLKREFGCLALLKCFAAFQIKCAKSITCALCTCVIWVAWNVQGFEKTSQNMRMTNNGIVKLDVISLYRFFAHWYWLNWMLFFCSFRVPLQIEACVCQWHYSFDRKMPNRWWKKSFEFLWISRQFLLLLTSSVGCAFFYTNFNWNVFCSYTERSSQKKANMPKMQITIHSNTEIWHMPTRKFLFVPFLLCILLFCIWIEKRILLSYKKKILIARKFSLFLGQWAR